MGHWLRYGLFGHQVLSIVNGEETWFHFFVLILFAALLLQMMFMTVYKPLHAAIEMLVFVLLFGYIMGLAMAITAGIIGFVLVLFKILPPPEPLAPAEAGDDDELDWGDVATLNDLGERARGRLSESEYATMEAEARTITTKAGVESFVNRWEHRI